jgi:hypothetical protein
MTAERDARSPRVAQRAGAGVGLRAARELAVELGEQRHAVDEAQFRTGRSEREVFRGRRAVDDASVFVSSRVCIMRAR